MILIKVVIVETPTLMMNKKNGCAFIWFRLKFSGVCNTHQVAKSMWIALKLGKCESLEQLKTTFERFGSFLKTLHILFLNI